LEKVHNTKKRTPVILPGDRENSWLDPDLEKDSLQALLQPYDPAEMEAYPVSRIINKLGLKISNPEVLGKRDYPDLSPL
jgi:putative SOS response-associated peptidase YedK